MIPIIRSRLVDGLGCRLCAYSNHCRTRFKDEVLGRIFESCLRASFFENQLDTRSWPPIPVRAAPSKWKTKRTSSCGRWSFLAFFPDPDMAEKTSRKE